MTRSAARSACTCTSRSARRAATTARSPRGPTVPTSSATTSTPCATDIDRAVDAGMAPATSVFVGGGTPTLVPADALAAVLARDPARPGRRGHGRVQPRRRRRGAARAVRRRRASTGSRSACSRWCRTCWPRSGARTTRPTSTGPSRPSAPSGCRRSTSTSSTARRASRSPTGGRRSSGRSSSTRRTCRPTR